MLQNHKAQYHINITPDVGAGYAILPGDPGRCEKIAAFIDDAKQISQNREYNIWKGYLSDTPVLVCSTGIGGPSTAIAVEELAACGVHTMIRIGTCGGISMDVCAGDIVIASGAVRQDGTSREYAPIEFPAVPSTSVLFALVEAARQQNRPVHTGVVQSKDSFYGQHSPQRMPTSSELNEKWQAWKRLGVLASEMEASTLFTVGATLNVRTGAVFLSVWNQERANAGLDTDTDEVHDTTAAIKVAVDAIKLLINESK